MRSLTCLLMAGILIASAAVSAAERSDQYLEEKMKRLERRLERLEAERTEIREKRKEDSELQKRVEKLEEDQADWEMPETLRAYWDEGLKFDSNDGNFQLKIGGRIMTDFAWWAEESDQIEMVVGDPLEDYVEFRRARLYASGKLYGGTVDYKAQYDFGGGKAGFKDVKVGIPPLLGPVGKLTIGHQKEPFSLEEQTSSKYITFMERGLPNAFSPGRNTGFRVDNAVLDERLTYAFGAFDSTDGFGEDMGDGDWGITGRVTGLPWYDQDGSGLLHLGLSATYRAVDNDRVSFDSSPEIHDAPDFMDTGDFTADSLTKYSAEAALVYGPFSLQGEYMVASMDTKAGSSFDDPTFDGYYLYASYFLTGEHRAYKKGSGAFGRIAVERNAFEDGGIGAWELGLRYSNLNFDDGVAMPAAIPAGDPGEMENWTLGLNWYLNPNMRVMFNVVRSNLDRGAADDDVTAFMTRFQIDF